MPEQTSLEAISGSVASDPCLSNKLKNIQIDGLINIDKEESKCKES